jgi:hypothetical protein
MKIKNLSTMITVVLIATLFGFGATYGQFKSDMDTVTCAPTYEELLTAIEIFSSYANEQLETTLLYRDEISSLEYRVAMLKLRRDQLEYAESIQNRLAYWMHLQAKNSK